MRTKHIIIVLLFILLLCTIGGYLWITQKKQAEAEKQVRAWQENVADHLSFDYKTLNTHLWNNGVTLQHVQVTYPVLLSVDSLTIEPHVHNDILQALYIQAKNINFNLPFMTGDQSWQGNLALHYDYDPDLKQVDLSFSPDFPQFLVADIKTAFVNITPSVDIIFNYTDVLLVNLNLELQKEGFIQNNRDVWMNMLANNEQRDAFANFLDNKEVLYIHFMPEYPVPVYRLLESPKLLWQHPAIEIRS